MCAESVALPASTVLVLQNTPDVGPEVLLVQRREDAVFMGSAHVFPGGRVDASDGDEIYAQCCDGLEQVCRQLPDLDPAAARAYRVAAVRELFEEAGLLLARRNPGVLVDLSGDLSAVTRYARHRADVHAGRRALHEVAIQEGLRLALDALVPFAHWVTPPVDARRFDTRFFLASRPADQSPDHDRHETTGSRWITPSGALDAARQGQIILPPPTWTSLRELEGYRDVGAMFEAARAAVMVRREPRVLHRNGQKMLLMPGDPEFPDPTGVAPQSETRFVWSSGRWVPDERVDRVCADKPD